MAKDQPRKNLQKASYENQQLANANFSNSDLRGADFSGANLSGANFTNVRTGILPLTFVLLFLVALAVSLLSGYVAMLSGRTIQEMLRSTDSKIRLAGIITIVIIFIFIVYAWWKGGEHAIRNLLLPVIIAAALVGVVAYVSGLGTGKGMLYQIIALVLALVMFIVGTIARSAAGALSNILFIVVALSGGMFGKSVGGGIGTVVMAISCAMISKRALGGAMGFDSLRKIATSITKKHGTSFRNANLAGANFSQSTIRNADFTGADISTANWEDSKKINCLISENKFAPVK